MHTAWNPSAHGETVVVATLFGVPAKGPMTITVEESENACLDGPRDVDRG